LQPFTAVVPADCPRSGSPTHRGIALLCICTNYTFTAQLAHVYERVPSGRYYTGSPQRSAGQEGRILWEPEGSDKAPTDFRGNKHPECCYGLLWLSTVQHQHPPAGEPSYLSFTSF